MNAEPLALHGIYDRQHTRTREAYWAGVKQWWLTEEMIARDPAYRGSPAFGHYPDVPEATKTPEVTDV